MFNPETVWEFAMVDRVKFGVNALDDLNHEIESFGGKSVLIVTDEGVKEAGIVDEIIEAIGGNIEHAVFSRVSPDPPRSIFEDSIEFAQDFQPDLIIGLGGGSSIDVAKTTSVVSKHGGDLLDYVAPPTGEGYPVPGSGWPMIAIPTTAGTGSETSPVSVISLPDKKLKVGISSRYQYPNLALVDPALTVSLPPDPTASSGLDALSHAIESYTTRPFDAKPSPDSPAERPDYDGRNIVTDQFARRAIQLISSNLRRAYNNGQNLNARQNMSLASLMAGIAFTNAGLGATHAMAYPVAGEHHTPHGVTVATLLPAVMQYNATSSFERYREIAELMGEPVSGLSPDEAAERAAVAVDKLRRDVGIPDGLTEFGVTEAEIPELAADTVEIQRLLVGNPRRANVDDIEQIFQWAM